jgi:hypothetical protein
MQTNWCWWKGGWFKPPYSIFFDTSCRIHDVNYDNWWTEDDRLKADKWLLKYMSEDVTRLTKWKQPYFYMWCYIYYIGVRLFWRKYFNYIK